MATPFILQVGGCVPKRERGQRLNRRGLRIACGRRGMMSRGEGRRQDPAGSISYKKILLALRTGQWILPNTCTAAHTIRHWFSIYQKFINIQSAANGICISHLYARGDLATGRMQHIDLSFSGYHAIRRIVDSECIFYFIRVWLIYCPRILLSRSELLLE